MATNKKVISYIIEAQEEELKRIAHELHEGVAQTLYSTITGLRVIEGVLDNRELKDYTVNMINQLVGTIHELRKLSTELYPPSLDQLGFMSALKAYVKIYTSTYGIPIHFQSKGIERRFPLFSEVTLLRVCQEVLYNIAKYADTTRINIHFSWEEDFLFVLIQDYGCGFNLQEVLDNKELLGIPGMMKRMELINGQIRIHSEIGRGTEVELSLPLETGGEKLDQNFAS